MNSKRKTNRAECFLGLHFDFHAMEGESVGSIIDTKSISHMLDETQPDMIQVDSKGHSGISSYLTKAGRHAQQMHMDVLRVWRELTESRNIRLYAHHSGLYDRTQVRLHPDWAVVDADGTASSEYLSPFSPYVDRVLIPQILEIAGEYRCNGIWVDGDCWGVFVDYSPYAVQAWQKERNCPPPRPGNADYAQYREFCREGFRRYVSRYIEAVKSQYPDFEITSNWIYSYFMPERCTIPVDYLSGDYTCHDSVRDAREVGRCFSNRRIPWDLMAWGQNAMPLEWQTRNRCTKEAEQLCQEAAVVLGLGGGFQFFNILYGTGGLVQSWAVSGWKQVAQFCREREAYCFGAESIADIGVIYPGYYTADPEVKSLFSGGAWNSVRGWVCAVADAGFSCNIVYEADIGDLSKYKVLILPKADTYGETTLEQLKTFAALGGTVITDGGVFLDERSSGAVFHAAGKQLLFLDSGDRLSAIETEYWEPELTTAKKLLYCYEQNYYYDPEKHLSCIENPVGNGKVVSLCSALGSVYRQNITYALKQYIRAIFGNCGYVPPVSVSGSDYADVSLMKKDGKIMVNILNMAGESNAAGVRTFREIPRIGPLTVTLHCSEKPKHVIWQPDGTELQLTKTADGYCCTIGRLHIHGVLEIQ